jgi:hypothetical protein
VSPLIACPVDHVGQEAGDAARPASLACARSGPGGPGSELAAGVPCASRASRVWGQVAVAGGASRSSIRHTGIGLTVRDHGGPSGGGFRPLGATRRAALGPGRAAAGHRRPAPAAAAGCRRSGPPLSSTHGARPRPSPGPPVARPAADGQVKPRAPPAARAAHGRNPRQDRQASPSRAPPAPRQSAPSASPPCRAGAGRPATPPGPRTPGPRWCRAAAPAPPTRRPARSGDSPSPRGPG